MKRGSLCKKKGMGMDMAVSIKQLIDKLELQNLTPEVDREYFGTTEDNVPVMFPFSSVWWKPSPENRIKELAKAGALIAAEIDRLQRLGHGEDM